MTELVAYKTYIRSKIYDLCELYHIWEDNGVAQMHVSNIFNESSTLEETGQIKYIFRDMSSCSLSDRWTGL